MSLIFEYLRVKWRGLESVGCEGFSLQKAREGTKNAQYHSGCLLAPFTEMRKLKERNSVGAFGGGEWS